MRGALPTGAVTFLFTDIEGSTKLLLELAADRYAKALAEHRRIIREAVSARGGVEVGTGRFLRRVPHGIRRARCRSKGLLPRIQWNSTSAP